MSFLLNSHLQSHVYGGILRCSSSQSIRRTFISLQTHATCLSISAFSFPFFTGTLSFSLIPLLPSVSTPPTPLILANLRSALLSALSSIPFPFSPFMFPLLLLPLSPLLLPLLRPLPFHLKPKNLLSPPTQTNLSLTQTAIPPTNTIQSNAPIAIPTPTPVFSTALSPCFFAIIVGVEEGPVANTVLTIVRILPVSDTTAVDIWTTDCVTVGAWIKLCDAAPAVLMPDAVFALPFPFDKIHTVGCGFAAIFPLMKTTRTAAYLVMYTLALTHFT
jgi:hypothetical protein